MLIPLRRSIGLAASTLLIILGVTPASALTLEFVPQTQTVLLGDTVSVDAYLNFDGNPSAPLVHDFSVNVGWNASLLAMTGVVFDAYLNGGISSNSTQTVTPGAGSATISEISLLDSLGLCVGITAGGQCWTSTGFRLFTLNFNTLSAGFSILAFSPIVAHDDNDLNNPITIASGPNGAVTVMSAPAAPAPEPVTLPLLGSGLFALALARRCRRAR